MLIINVAKILSVGFKRGEGAPSEGREKHVYEEGNGGYKAGSLCIV